MAGQEEFLKFGDLMKQIKLMFLVMGYALYQKLQGTIKFMSIHGPLLEIGNLRLYNFFWGNLLFNNYTSN